MSKEMREQIDRVKNWKQFLNENKKSLSDFIGKKLELKELPQLRYDKPNVSVGNKYKIIDVEGSNFWLIDDDGEKTTFHSGRFDLENF